MMIKTTLYAAVFALVLLGVANVDGGAISDAALKRGFIQCGVNTGIAGFSQPDSHGEWRGIDVDFCRAVAAALFGDARKARYTPLTAQQRFTALQSGEVDILSRNTTWTMSRDTSLGLNFVGINFYDGQGFMVAKKRQVKSAKQLSGATVCVQPGTTTELNLADYFRANNLKLKPVVVEKIEEVLNAYFAGALRRLHDGCFRAHRGAGFARSQSRRSRDPSGSHFQRAIRPCGAAWRRSLVRRGEVVLICND